MAEVCGIYHITPCLQFPV